MLFGDEQKALVETERLVREHIGCHVVHGSQYYRPQGHLQAAFNDQPVQVNCLAALPASMHPAISTEMAEQTSTADHADQSGHRSNLPIC